MRPDIQVCKKRKKERGEMDRGTERGIERKRKTGRWRERWGKRGREGEGVMYSNTKRGQGGKKEANRVCLSFSSRLFKLFFRLEWKDRFKIMTT